MSSSSSRIRRRVLLALLVAATVVVVSRLRSPAVGRSPRLPSIGGDTWPPVPVKDAGGA